MSPTQIISSIAEYLNNKLRDHGSIYIDSIDQVTPSSYPRFEIHFDGPNKEVYTKNCIKYEISILVVVITQNELNRLKHHTLVDIAVNALSNPIPIVVNNLTIDCLQTTGTVELNQYGSLDENNNIIQTGVNQTFFVHSGA